MRHTKNMLTKHWFSCTLVLTLATTFCNCTYAQSTPKFTSVSSTNTTSAPGYKGIYVVITSDTDKGMLENIENKLNRWGVQFKAKNVSFDDGKLTGITIDVDIPEVYKSTITHGNGSGPLSEPVIFYHETSTGAGLSTSVPEGLSDRGKMVVTDNLKGVLIMYDADNMEFSGTVHTN